MNLKKLQNRLVEIILKICRNSIVIGFLVFFASLTLLFSSFRTVAATLIPFVFFMFVLLGSLIISILLTLFNLRFNSIVKKIGLIKGLETLSYFSLIVFIFFKINYFVSFRTIDTCLYENCKRKITHNILGQSIYKVYIYDHQWDDWSSSGWVHVDSTTYYGARNFIKINYNMGIFGFKIIPKNQKNK